MAIHRRLTELYGNYWEKALYNLKRLGANRRNLVKEIKVQMELFHLQLGRVGPNPNLNPIQGADGAL